MKFERGASVKIISPGNIRVRDDGKIGIIERVECMTPEFVPEFREYNYHVKFEDGSVWEFEAKFLEEMEMYSEKALRETIEKQLKQYEMHENVTDIPDTNKKDEYLQQVVTIGGSKIPVGIVKEFISLSESECARLIYQRINHNKAPRQIWSLAECLDEAKELQCVLQTL